MIRQSAVLIQSAAFEQNLFKILDPLFAFRYNNRHSMIIGAYPVVQPIHVCRLYHYMVKQKLWMILELVQRYTLKKKLGLPD